MSLMNQDGDCCCTVDLIDFSSGCNSESYQDPMIGMLKQKFRSPKRIAFSNKFEQFKSIELEGDDVFDVRISRSCSLIIAINNNCFVFIDYETLEIKRQVETEEECMYFELEEDYDYCGNDALLINYNRSVSKYDLKQFITEGESCKPIWTYCTGIVTSQPVSVMILDGKKVVVFNEDSCMAFLDTKIGTKLIEYTIKLEGSISGCVEPDRRKPNTLYLFVKEMMRFEYENGNWKSTSFTTDHSNIDGLCMDRVSGVLYFSGYCETKWSISAYTTSGTFIGTHYVICGGFCIDERTGLMYMAESNKISILK